MQLQDLDKLVDELLDLARENSIDDARIFVKDRIEKDIVGPAYNDGFDDAKAWAAKERICKCGIRVKPHRCNTESEF